MTPAPKRWFRWSLRRILFWDMPYVALVTFTLLRLRHLRPMTTWFTLDVGQRFAEAIGIALVYEQAALFTLAWLVLPFVWRATSRIAWLMVPSPSTSSAAWRCSRIKAAGLVFVVVTGLAFFCVILVLQQQMLPVWAFALVVGLQFAYAVAGNLSQAVEALE